MDIKWRRKLNILLHEFTKICNKNDIWYALDAGSLLGAIRHGGPIPWQEKMQVMMTPESYTKFERKVWERALDNFKYNWYTLNTPCFVKSKGEIVDEEPFVKIRLIVPTDGKRLKKYYSLRNVLNDIKRKTSYKEAVQDLFSDNHESFAFVGPTRFDRRKTTSLQVFNFEVEEKLFSGMKVNVPVDYEKILETWYGKDYMQASVPSIYYHYQSPLTKIKVKHAKHG